MQTERPRSDLILNAKKNLIQITASRVCSKRKEKNVLSKKERKEKHSRSKLSFPRDNLHLHLSLTPHTHPEPIRLPSFLWNPSGSEYFCSADRVPLRGEMDRTPRWKLIFILTIYLLCNMHCMLVRIFFISQRYHRLESTI
jgi:hypothetical protein